MFRKPWISLWCWIGCALLVSGAGASRRAAGTPLQQSSDSSKHPATAAPDYSSQPFVYEYIHTVMRYEDNGTGTREVRARLRVQTPAGLTKAGQLVFDYNGANERVEIRSVRATKPDGQVIEAGPDAVRDLTTPVVQLAPVYTDARQKHVTVPGLGVGDAIEYDVVTTTFEPLQQGQFWQTWNLTTDAICLDEQVDLNVPIVRPLRLKGPPGVEPTVRDDRDHRIYHWATSNLQYVEGQEFKIDVPSLLEGRRPPVPRQILFSTWQSWDEVGRWYDQLERDRRVVTPEIRARADEIVRGQVSPLDKAQALYNWVSQNIRYVSLSFGVGRYQPHAAAEVLANRYGDCKDKGTLLRAFFAAEGLPANAALINSKADVDRDVPSPLQFDHLITFTPLVGRDIWLDSTTGVGPFGYLLPQLRGKQALVVFSDADPALRKTPQKMLLPTLYRVQARGSYEGYNKLNVQIIFETRGDLEVLMRLAYLQLSPREVVALFNRSAATAGKKYGIEVSLSDFSASDPTDTRKPFRLETRLSVTLPEPNPSWSPTAILYTTDFINLSLMAKLIPDLPATQSGSRSDRQEPIELGGPREFSLDIRFTAPTETKLLPPPVHIAKDFAEYDSNLEWNDQTLHATWRLSLRVPEIPATRATDYADFRGRILTSFAAALTKLFPPPKRPAVAHLPAPATPSAPALSPEAVSAQGLYANGMKAFNSGNYPAAAEFLEGAVAKDPKHIYAWNDLGRTYINLRQYDKAVAALRKAIEVNPSDRWAYNNLGRALWRQKKYDEAAAAFHKQIEINPVDRFAHHNLGTLYLEMHRYSDAATELRSAAAVVPNDSSIQVNLGQAYLKLGRLDQAREAFDRALELAPAPSTWNSVAYAMALDKLDLERAQQYAAQAIAATTAQLHDVSLDNITMREVGLVRSLSAYWDTSGWIQFQQGNLVQAEKYVQAAWQLRDACEVGDHLAQIYEKEGRKADAIKTYELALAAPQPMQETRDRLAAILGGESNIDELVERARPELSARRTFKISNSRDTEGFGEFWVLLSPGPKVDSVKFILGDEQLRLYVDEIRSAALPKTFPEATDAKLPRRGRLSCSHSASECTFVFLSADSVQSVN